MNSTWVFLVLAGIFVFVPVSLYALHQFFRWLMFRSLPYICAENEMFVSFFSMGAAVVFWIATWIFFWTVYVKHLPI